MPEEKYLKQANEMFKLFCEMLEENNWHYIKDEENLTIGCGAMGDDLPIAITVRIDIQKQLVYVMSKLPFTVPEDRRPALAVAVSQANNGMADGNFDFDYKNGNILFRITSSFCGSLIGKKLFEYMLMCACYIIDEYNDKFLLLTQNNMTVEDILNFIK